MQLYLLYYIMSSSLSSTSLRQRRSQCNQWEESAAALSSVHSLLLFTFKDAPLIEIICWGISNPTLSAAGGVGRINRLPDWISANRIIPWFMKQQSNTSRRQRKQKDTVCVQCEQTSLLIYQAAEFWFCYTPFCTTFVHFQLSEFHFCRFSHFWWYFQKCSSTAGTKRAFRATGSR